MKGLVLVGVLFGFMHVAYADAETNRQDPQTTLLGAAAGAGVGAAIAEAHVWGVALTAAMLTVGPMLEYQSDCAKHGLTNYEGQNTEFGNGGYLLAYGPVSEERVKWEIAPNGWMQRKCQ